MTVLGPLAELLAVALESSVTFTLTAKGIKAGSEGQLIEVWPERGVFKVRFPDPTGESTRVRVRNNGADAVRMVEDIVRGAFV